MSNVQMVGSEEEMGSPISLEDALSIMVVIFVLFVVLFVPLIQLDKVNLDKAQKATFWSRVYTFVQKAVVSDQDDKRISNYFEGFYDLPGKKNAIHQVNRNLVILESVDDQENVTVILHNPPKKEYVMLISQEFSNELIYRYGTIQKDAGKYFTSADEVAYTGNPVVMKMKDKYVSWVKQTRNITPRALKEKKAGAAPAVN